MSDFGLQPMKIRNKFGRLPAEGRPGSSKEYKQTVAISFFLPNVAFGDMTNLN
jgi:hypothetical protein